MNSIIEHSTNIDDVVAIKNSADENHKMPETKITLKTMCKNDAILCNIANE